MKREVPLQDMVGKKLSDVTWTQDEINFFTECGTHYMMFHDQDCCESVYIDAIDGDLGKLIGGVVQEASESSSDPDYGEGELTWTFYRIRTDKEFCHITWRGSSNGYYSTGVSFVNVTVGDA